MGISLTLSNFQILNIGNLDNLNIFLGGGGIYIYEFHIISCFDFNMKNGNTCYFHFKCRVVFCVG